MKPLIDRDFLLEKFEGKGGWTYALIPEIAPDPHSPFGMVRVRGTVDGAEVRDYHLMPFSKGSGTLFLPLKLALRRRLKKGAGDTVRVILWREESFFDVPEELLLCLADDPAAAAFFDTLTDGERHQFVRWIAAAGSDDARVERIVKTIMALAENKKYYDAF